MPDEAGGVDSGEFPIEKHQIEAPGMQGFQVRRNFAGIPSLDSHTVRPQLAEHETQRGTDLGVIVGYEDAHF